MKKLYKVLFATVVLAEDKFAAQEYIKDHDKTDAFAFQGASAIETLEDLPLGWGADHFPVDTSEPYDNPWADDSIEGIIEKAKLDVKKIFGEIPLNELMQKYMELESRLLVVEEKNL